MRPSLPEFSTLAFLILKRMLQPVLLMLLFYIWENRLRKLCKLPKWKESKSIKLLSCLHGRLCELKGKGAVRVASQGFSNNVPPLRGLGLPWYIRVKNLPAILETPVRSLGQDDPPIKWNDNPLQHSCLENSMDRGAWRATVRGVAKSQTYLSNQRTEA